MNAHLKKNILRSLRYYRTYLENIDDKKLKNSVAGIDPDTVGHQLWCVIGARESYVKSLEEGSWQGFNCSVEKEHDLSQMKEKIESSAQRVKDFFEKKDIDWDGKRKELLVELLEHEILHQGKLSLRSYLKSIGKLKGED